MCVPYYHKNIGVSMRIIQIDMRIIQMNDTITAAKGPDAQVALADLRRLNPLREESLPPFFA
jgi:hypothetical protein